MSDRVIVWPSGRAPTLEEIEAELGRWDLADPDRAIENRTYWEYREAVGRVAEDLARWRVVFDPFDPDASLDPDLPLTLAAWSVARLDNGYAVSTVQFHLAAVGWWCATQLAHPAADVHRHAGLVVKAWAVENPRPVHGAGPVPRAWLAAMADAMAADGSPTALRDQVLLTWNLAGALRPGEPGTVAVDDLTIRPGVEIGWTFARSKGNRTGGRRDDQVILRPLPGDVLCPIAAWERWREVWPHTGADMPAIPSLLGGQQGLPDPAADVVLGVSEQNVNRMLARWAEQAGVPAPALVTGHALRHSAATFAILGGATEDAVRRLLRHAHVATTRRYIARLDPWVSVDEARRVLLGDHPDGLEGLGVERRASRRPAGPVRLGRRADRLGEAADLAAAGPMPPHTRRGVEFELRLWDEFCVEFGVDPAAPSATDLRLWFGWRMRRAQATATSLKAAGVPMKAGTARRALWCLERGLAARGVPYGTVTGEAWACYRGYARQVAGLVDPPESAAEYGLGELAALAETAGAFDPDDEARWAAGLAALALHPLDGGGTGANDTRGFPLVPPSAVSDPGDGTRIVAVGGFDPVVVRPGPKPPLDPVAALDHLLAVTPPDAATILAPDTLDRSKRVFDREGSKSAARLAAAGPEVAERAMWRLAAPLVACVQDQAAVALLTAGALRYDDVRRLRRDTSPEWRVWASGSSWASHLAGSKGNPAEGETVWLDGALVDGHPALDPAANLARLVAWTPWTTGPAITAITGHKSWRALLDPSAPPRPMPYRTLLARLVAVAERAGMPGLSLHSFRQSAATAAWWHNKTAGMSDAENYRALMRRLRHDDPTSTLAYVNAADPGVSITADVHLDPLEVPDAAPTPRTRRPVTAAA